MKMYKFLENDQGMAHVRLDQIVNTLLDITKCQVGIFCIGDEPDAGTYAVYESPAEAREAYTELLEAIELWGK